MFCDKCGCKLKDEETVCPNCETKITDVETVDLIQIFGSDKIYFDDFKKIFKLVTSSIFGTQKNKNLRNITFIFISIFGICIFICLGAFIPSIINFIFSIQNIFDSFWKFFGISPRIGGNIIFAGIVVIVFLILKNNKKM